MAKDALCSGNGVIAVGREIIAKATFQRVAVDAFAAP